MRVEIHLPLGKVDPGLRGIYSRVEFSIAVESADDAEILGGLVNAIQSPNTSAEERASWETNTNM